MKRLQGPNDWQRVRQVCIENDFYTEGSCEEYEALLFRIRDVGMDLEYVIKNIYNHSDESVSYKRVSQEIEKLVL